MWFFILDSISIFYKEFDVHSISIIFAPIFGIEDINSSALGVIGLAGMYYPFCDLLRRSPVPLGSDFDFDFLPHYLELKL